jgi:hypothetical protein
MPRSSPNGATENPKTRSAIQALVEQLQAGQAGARIPRRPTAPRAGTPGTTQNGVGDGSHPQSFRQLLRKGKENGHVDGAELLRVLPGHVLGAPEKLEEVLALFRRHSVAVRAWQPPVMMRKPEPRRRPASSEEYEGYRSNDPCAYAREMGAIRC